MNKLNPGKLIVTLQNVDPTKPITPRYYTLTHSDTMGILFLTIDRQYAYSDFTPMNDQVLAKWSLTDHGFILCATVDIDGPFSNPKVSAVRYTTFKQELPLSLEAIRYGDRLFFEAHPKLDRASIWISFNSAHPQYHKFEFYGIPANYS